MKTKLLRKIRKKFNYVNENIRENTVSLKTEVTYKDFYDVNDLFRISKSEIVNVWHFKNKRHPSLYKKDKSLRECIIWAKKNLLWIEI